MPPVRRIAESPAHQGFCSEFCAFAVVLNAGSTAMMWQPWIPAFAGMTVRQACNKWCCGESSGYEDSNSAVLDCHRLKAFALR